MVLQQSCELSSQSCFNTIFHFYKLILKVFATVISNPGIVYIKCDAKIAVGSLLSQVYADTAEKHYG